MTPEERIAYNARLARDRHQATQVEQQQQKERQIPPLQVQLWDSDRQAYRATTTDGSVRYVKSLTNGAIAAGAATRPGRDRIDGMPRRRKQITSTVETKIGGFQYLYQDPRLPQSLEDWSSVFADFGQIDKTTKIQNLTLSSLRKAKVYIGLPLNFSEVYTPEEVASIKTFVSSGGSLLIFGENGEFYQTSVNSLVSAFGFELSNRNYPTPWVRNGAIASPLLDGRGGTVNSVLGTGSGDWSVMPANAIAAMVEAADSTKITVVSARFGGGKIALIADTNAFSSDFYYLDPNHQNRALLINTARWLLQ